MGINEPDHSFILKGFDLGLKSEDTLSRTSDHIALIHSRECAQLTAPPDVGHGLILESASARDDTFEALDGLAASLRVRCVSGFRVSKV